MSRTQAEDLLSAALAANTPAGEAPDSSTSETEGNPSATAAQADVNRRRRASRRLRDYFNDAVDFKMRGSSILEDRQIGKKARRNYQKALDSFMRFVAKEER